MDLQQLIADKWTGTASDLADAINSRLADPVSTWTVTRWVNGTQPGPRRPEVLKALADALGVKLDVVRRARGVPQSNVTQARLDVIEDILKARGWMTSDGRPAGEVLADQALSEVDRRPDVG